jgi:hypothetical protein
MFTNPLANLLRGTIFQTQDSDENTDWTIKELWFCSRQRTNIFLFSMASGLTLGTNTRVPEVLNPGATAVGA